MRQETRDKKACFGARTRTLDGDCWTAEAEEAMQHSRWAVRTWQGANTQMQDFAGQGLTGRVQERQTRRRRRLSRT